MHRRIDVFDLLRARSLRNVHPSYRRRLVRAGLGPVEQRLQVVQQVLLVASATCRMPTVPGMKMTPSLKKTMATMTVTKTSKKPSTQRWMIQKRQVSTTEKLLVLEKK